MIELYEQQVAETRRMNASLERIATTLERREPARSFARLWSPRWPHHLRARPSHDFNFVYMFEQIDIAPVRVQLRPLGLV
jgi:hypothetical protein